MEYAITKRTDLATEGDGIDLNQWLALIDGHADLIPVPSRYLRPMWASDWPEGNVTAALFGPDRLEYLDGTICVSDPSEETLLLMDQLAVALSAHVAIQSGGYFGIDGSYLGVAA